MAVAILFVTLTSHSLTVDVIGGSWAQTLTSVDPMWLWGMFPVCGSDLPVAR